MLVLDGFNMKGRLRLVTRDAVTGEVVEDSGGDNLIVTSGLNTISAALNWAFVQNYNDSWGDPFSASSGNLADVYGAVGLSLNTPAAADTALGSEVGRQLITTGTNSSNVLTFQFFFPTTSGNGIITEVGVFTNATTQQVALTVALNQNQTYTSLTVTATTAVIPSGSTLTIGYGTSVQQQVVTSGSTSAGATTINVTSFIANASFAIGSAVAYNTGTLLDHALLSAPVTKTSAQTATLQLSMTLQSA